MATITNKTHRPLSVSLPGGKKLHLGPLKSGEISPKAVDHAAVRKLVEAGEVEISDSEQHHPAADDGGAKSGRAMTGGAARGGNIRRTGDR